LSLARAFTSSRSRDRFGTQLVWQLANCLSNLLPLWTERLAGPNPEARTILAEIDGSLVGLAHTLLGEDAAWGAFLDNLHVAHGLKRQGIGTRLLALTGQQVVDWSPASGLYLWVLEQNSDARAFYAARGAACVERADVPPPGGDPSRLNGKPVGLRYAWRDPSKLSPGSSPGAGPG
jgi:GNAT superfamily N-acetyltransferase